MRKNWIGTIALVGVSVIAGSFFSQIWEQVQGQPVGFAVEQVQPQVVVQQPPELPKWCVNFAMLQPGLQVITIVDTETKRIAVYHLDMGSGGVSFKSIRGIQHDLMVEEYNALTPLPTEIMRRFRETDLGRN